MWASDIDIEVEEEVVPVSVSEEAEYIIEELTMMFVCGRSQADFPYNYLGY